MFKFKFPLSLSLRHDLVRAVCQQIMLCRFTLDWLTDGKDKIVK